MRDNNTKINHISLCTGYGGIDLGLKRVVRNLRTVAYCEIEAFVCANLVSKMEAGLMDPAPIWTNLKLFPFGKFRGKVDFLSGGYPCQPWSAAGKRKGKDDPRHLWPWIAEGIKDCQPKLCLFENVEGHISLGLSTVVSDLEELGYKVSWGIFSASESGAPHQRKRVFILAGRNEWLADATHQLSHWSGTSGQIRGAESSDSGGFVADALGDGRKQGRPKSKGRKGRPEVEFVSEDVAHGDGPGLEGQSGNVNIVQESGRLPQGQDRPSSSHGLCTWPTGPGQQQFWWEPPRTIAKPEKRSGSVKPKVGGNTDGLARRLDDAELYVSLDNRQDELRMLGNGVVPVVAENAFRTLLGELQAGFQ